MKINILTTLFLLCQLALGQALEEGYSSNSAVKPEVKEIEYKKHRIGINIGGSNSLGEFSEIDPNKETSGYAEGGLILDIGYQFSFDKNFAATFLYGSTGNRFDAQSFANQLAFEEPSLSWRVEADAWGVGFVMVGVKGFFGERAKGYINPMIGTATMIAPQIDITASNGVSSVTQRVRASEATRGSILGISFGVDLIASDLISINLDCTYLSSEFDISQLVETFDINGNPILVESAYKQPYKTLNFSVGLGFNF